VVNLAVSFERMKRFGGAEGCQGRTCKQRCSDGGLDIQGPLGHHDEAMAYILTFSRSMASQLQRTSPFDLPLAHVFLHLRPSFCYNIPRYPSLDSRLSADSPLVIDKTLKSPRNYAYNSSVV
jgi:hypothetical protein